MSFFSKIGKTISKGVKSVGRTVGKLATKVAPIATLIPGIGAPVAAGLSILGGVLGPKSKLEPAVQDARYYLGAQPAVLPPVVGPPAPPAAHGFNYGAVAAAAALYFLLR